MEAQLVCAGFATLCLIAGIAILARTGWTRYEEPFPFEEREENND